MKKNKYVTIGIDLSITCPAITVHIGKKWNWKNCIFHYYTSHKKSLFEHKMFQGAYYADWHLDMERYGNISDYILSIVEKYSPQSINLEGYSFGSTGQVYNIGENGGILKWRLFSAGYSCNILPPTVIKKFATGKGNANKALMYEHFVLDTNLNLCDILSCKTSDKSPCSDVVDSYFICKYGLFN
jgi:Holliday junction resolvasome RuvABC endonuclease subunit